jgi:hypothetical protein
MIFLATWSGITLADTSAGDVVSAPRINGVPATQVATGLRAASVKVFNRGNVQTTVAFTNRRPPFGSPTLAAQFQASHAIALAAVSAPADLLFTIGIKTYAVRDTVVTRREPIELFGTTVGYSYEITGGLLVNLT